MVPMLGIIHWSPTGRFSKCVPEASTSTRKAYHPVHTMCHFTEENGHAVLCRYCNHACLAQHNISSSAANQALHSDASPKHPRSHSHRFMRMPGYSNLAVALVACNRVVHHDKALFVVPSSARDCSGLQIRCIGLYAYAE